MFKLIYWLLSKQTSRKVSAVCNCYNRRLPLCQPCGDLRLRDGQIKRCIWWRTTTDRIRSCRFRWSATFNEKKSFLMIKALYLSCLKVPALYLVSRILKTPCFYLRSYTVNRRNIHFPPTLKAWLHKSLFQRNLICTQKDIEWCNYLPVIWIECK